MSTGEIAWRARNPIFNRELVTLLRSKKAFVLLGVYLAILIALVLVSWPKGTTSLLYQGALSRELFSIFAVGQTILLALLIPATLGSCMTMEKEGETLDLLLTTPVTADRIVLGKLASGLFYFVLLQLASVPVLLLCFVIGGLGFEDVAGLTVYLLVQLVVYGLTSVNCSTYFHRTHVSIILSYVFVGMEAFAMGAVYGDGLEFITGARLTPFLFVSGIVAAALYGIARVGVRRPYTPVRKTIEEEDVSRQVGLVIRRDRYPDRLIVPARRTAPMEDGVNPVLDKELQSEIYGSGSLFIRLVIQLGMFISLGAFLWVLTAALRAEDLSMLHPEYGYFCFVIAYVMILGPSMAATTFTREKEERTMESLILTLIPRERIVMGKFWAIARVVGALAFLNSWGMAMVVLLSSFNFSQIPALAIVIVAVTAFATALGMFLSLVCRTTLAASVTTYFALFGLFFVPVFLKTFLTRFFPGVSEQSFEFLTYLSPFLASEMEPGRTKEFLLTLSVHGSMYVGAAAVLIWLTARLFEPVMRRQSQMR